MTSNSSFYEQVVALSRQYLGSFADIFIERQVESHLHKPAHDMSGNDLEKILDWIKAAVACLTDDDILIEEYTLKLRKLSNSDSPRT